jgi:hypothetical protein
VLTTATVAGPDLPTVLHPERPGEASSGLVLRYPSARPADRPHCLLVHQKAPAKPLASAMGGKGRGLDVSLVLDMVLDVLQG